MKRQNVLRSMYNVFIGHNHYNEYGLEGYGFFC